MGLPRPSRDAGQERRPLPFNPKAADVAELAEALKGLVFQEYPATTPAWLASDEDDPPAHEMVAVRNGLLHVPTRTLRPHTPRLFTPTALPFDFDPDASTPDPLWRFLRDLWGDDPESAALCQEIFGYSVSGSNALQKILLLIGPPRAGKGTIARLLTQLLGGANVVAPTLGQLASDFGLSSLIGKSLAVIGDARLSRRSDPVVVVERLLSISGGDQIDVNRKYRDYWTGTLPCRILVLTNEMPMLHDSSGTLASRLVPLTFTRSFLGREDETLGDRLAAELPGVLNWALQGLDRLTQNRRFTIPPASLAMQGQLTHLSSAILRFVDECCFVGPHARCPTQTLYQHYCDWRTDLGLKHVSEIEFGRDLKAAKPEIATGRGPESVNLADGKTRRPREYVGIAAIRA